MTAFEYLSEDEKLSKCLNYALINIVGFLDDPYRICELVPIEETKSFIDEAKAMKDWLLVKCVLDAQIYE